jgi:hypothetical protein
MNAIRLAALIEKIDDKSFFSHTFPPEQMKKFEGDPAGLVKYYRDDYELIYRDGRFLIDDELKSLGIDSNRRVETLEQLIALLEKGENDRPVRNLLARYTEQSFETAGQWRAWFEEVRDRLYFSDVGGV